MKPVSNDRLIGDTLPEPPPPRAGSWTAPPLPRRKRVADYRWPLNLAFFLVMIAGWRGGPAVFSRLMLVSLAVFLAAILAEWLTELASLRRGRIDRSLADAHEEDYPVEINVVANGLLLGTDRGLVWFDGPLMGFSGRSTSFLLAATDLLQPEGLVISEWDSPYRPLKPKVAGGRVQVRVRPLLGFAGRYRRKMREFLHARKPADAERQWPPLEPYPAGTVDERELSRMKEQGGQG